MNKFLATLVAGFFTAAAFAQAPAAPAAKKEEAKPVAARLPQPRLK